MSFADPNWILSTFNCEIKVAFFKKNIIMATRFKDYPLEIYQNDRLRIICVYQCHIGNEIKRHNLTLVFNVVEPPTETMSLDEVFEFFINNIIIQIFLPLQSFHVKWISIKIIKENIPYRYPLNLIGFVKQGIGTLRQGLEIEFQRAYNRQPNYTYLYGMPLNFEAVEHKNHLFERLEQFYLNPIGEKMSIRYLGGSIRISDRPIMSCIIRGHLGSKKKEKKTRRT